MLRYRGKLLATLFCLPLIFAANMALAFSNSGLVGPAQVSNGLSFQCWISQGRIAPAATEPTSISFGLLITNVSKKPIRVCTYMENWAPPRLTDPNGKELIAGGQIDLDMEMPTATESDYPLLKPGDKCIVTIVADATLQDGSVSLNHKVGLSQWTFKNLAPGRYQLTIPYLFRGEPTTVQSDDRKSTLPISEVWEGDIFPPPLTFEIAQN